MNPRLDDLDTRGKLVAAAAHLFARRGIEAVPLRDVGELAGQRNASVVQYYFDGRWDLVGAVLAWQTTPLDPERATRPDEPVATVIARFVDQVAESLATAGGRDFLRILFEVMARFPDRFNRSSPGFAEWIGALDRIVDARGPLPRAVARARAVAMSQMVIHQMAIRARAVDDDAPRALDEAAFIGNLKRMATGMVTAPPVADPPPSAPL